MPDTTETTPLEVIADGPVAENVDRTLGKRMGRDARRVARGDLSQATFYERYHEDVVEEFGVDNRSRGGTDE
ncbi:MAG: 4Fe-4S ferredoxin N-terminal domain-containing protein [Halanaeroarchaeum sp.]